MKNPPVDWNDQSPRRHRGYVLAFLLLMAVVYTIFAATNIQASMSKDLATALLRETPGWVLPAVTICMLLNVVWLAAVFFWKRAGVYGFFLTSAAIAAANSQNAELRPYLVAGTTLILAPPVLLFLVLNLGSPHSTWRDMK